MGDTLLERLEDVRKAVAMRAATAMGARPNRWTTHEATVREARDLIARLTEEEKKS